MSFSAQAHAAQGGGGVAASIVGSMLLHAGIIVAFLSLRPNAGPPPPPFYRVNLIAAQPSAVPEAGRVTPPKTIPPPTVTKAPPRLKTEEVAPVPKTTAAPPVADKRATPNPTEAHVDRKAPAPVAGGGEVGGPGTDVANVKTDGIDFQFPGYLENIVRQIRLRFKPPANLAALNAEVAFLIRRDGTVTLFRFTKESRDYRFNLEVQGAVESASTDKAFGPLPTAFKDDVLPVMFSFDPRLIRR